MTFPSHVAWVQTIPSNLCHFLKLSIARVESQCGNYRVETGEQCDAGALGMVGQDPCCNEQCNLSPGSLCRCVVCVCVVCVCVVCTVCGMCVCVR